METSSRNRCARCGNRLKRGGTSYILRAELVSAFDGYIFDSGADFKRQLEKLNRQTEGLGEKEMEEQVYKRIEYPLCIECRDEIDRFLAIESEL